MFVVVCRLLIFVVGICCLLLLDPMSSSIVVCCSMFGVAVCNWSLSLFAVVGCRWLCLLFLDVCSFFLGVVDRCLLLFVLVFNCWHSLTFAGHVCVLFVVG